MGLSFAAVARRHWRSSAGETLRSRDTEVPDIEQTIHDFLLSDPDLAIRANRLSFDQSLIAGGLVDSLAVLGVVEFLESRFELRLDPEDLTGENFDSIAAMAELVRARRAPKA